MLEITEVNLDIFTFLFSISFTFSLKQKGNMTTYMLWQPVRHSSHQGGSPQNGLGDERTCGTTLALAYVLCHLSAMWSQLQMKERKSEWK